MTNPRPTAIEVNKRNRAVSELVDNSPVFFRTTQTDSTINIEDFAGLDFNRSKPLMPVPELSDDGDNLEAQKNDVFDKSSVKKRSLPQAALQGLSPEFMPPTNQEPA
jgi:hypothetical protein